MDENVFGWVSVSHFVGLADQDKELGHIKMKEVIADCGEIASVRVLEFGIQLLQHAVLKYFCVLSSRTPCCGLLDILTFPFSSDRVLLHTVFSAGKIAFLWLFITHRKLAARSHHGHAMVALLSEAKMTIQLVELASRKGL